ncbi:GNAT family N-acetyltransferase [Peptacetobacter hominis]|uniref:GNAT family N-acetyltransferase n=1 Tax=Peptacetobacter hominis TaxID=2743610 RepID=A0A544QY80_9FIRM|nr:GNAT family N-acetyltransferase [Peptacetobacter hominis]TQQ85686.1 GNAT family N-acetyltransferase [Peptacetobacter hominis]
MENSSNIISDFYYSKNFSLENNKILTLRNAVTSDAEEIVAFFKEVSDESLNLSFSSDEYEISPYQEKVFISSINRNYSSIIILGFIDDEICCIAEMISPPERRLSHNSNFSITVRKKYWNMGIAKTVIPEAIDYAKTVDIKNITLSVRSENSAAINLYKRFGFEVCGIRKDYICINGNYDDEIIMQLQIL